MVLKGMANFGTGTLDNRRTSSKSRRLTAIGKLGIAVAAAPRPGAAKAKEHP
jgi:hypothetical protein